MVERLFLSCSLKKKKNLTLKSCDYFIEKKCIKIFNYEEENNSNIKGSKVGKG